MSITTNVVVYTVMLVITTTSRSMETSVKAIKTYFVELDMDSSPYARV